MLNHKNFNNIIPAILDMSAVTAVNAEADKKVSTNITKGGMVLLEFWTKFQDIAFANEEFASLFRRRKPTSANWMNFSTGNGNCQISISNKLSKGEITIEACFFSQELFYKTLEHKEEILALVGEPFEWISFDQVSSLGAKGKTAFIRLNRNMQSNNQDNWPQISKQLSENMIALRKAIAPYIDKK